LIRCQRYLPYVGAWSAEIQGLKELVQKNGSEDLGRYRDVYNRLAMYSGVMRANDKDVKEELTNLRLRVAANEASTEIFRKRVNALTARGRRYVSDLIDDEAVESDGEISSSGAVSGLRRSDS